MIKRFKYTIILLVVAALIITALVNLVVQSHKCDERGGAYAKTATGYKCMKELP